MAWGYDAALRDLLKWARGSNCGWGISGVCDFCGRLARGELIGLRGNEGSGIVEGFWIWEIFWRGVILCVL